MRIDDHVQMQSKYVIFRPQHGIIAYADSLRLRFAGVSIPEEPDGVRVFLSGSRTIPRLPRVIHNRTPEDSGWLRFSVLEGAGPAFSGAGPWRLGFLSVPVPDSQARHAATPLRIRPPEGVRLPHAGACLDNMGKSLALFAGVSDIGAVEVS